MWKLETLANVGLSGIPTQQNVLFFQGAELPVSLLKTRFRVELVADGISKL